MGIILASQSPRRKELLELAGIEHRVIVSQVDEILDEDLDVAGQVQDLAIQKACAVAELFPQETIIGADTIVVFGGKILGKPKNEEDAFNMLKSLSGRKHQVMTGVSIINKDKELLTSFVNITEVEFYNVTDEWILNYIQSGEPMDNYDNIVKFIELLTDEHGLHISQRNLTVSTCGLVPRMKQLADLKLQITLALSLHASSQEKRKELMPVANSYELSEVLDACRYYFDKTGRRITFEYSLVGGVNDTDEDAERLVKLVSGMNCHINLIPVNPIKERDYVQSDHEEILKFKNKLEKNGINVTIRREMGADIDGACGQLRKSFIDKSNEQP